MMTFLIVVLLLSLHFMPPDDKAGFSGLDKRTLQTVRSPTCMQRIAQTSAGPEEQNFPCSARTRRNLPREETLTFGCFPEIAERSLGSIKKSRFLHVASFCACGPNTGNFAPRVQRSFEAASGSQLLKLRLAAQEISLLESCKQR